VNKLLRGIRSLFNVLPPKHWGPFMEVSTLTRFDHAVSVSWSQGGEDLALLHVFSNQMQGDYLDVGAHHPDRFSVTRHLYERGWSGVNVEANPKLMPMFFAKRKRDKNLNFVVGPQEHYELAVFTETAISTVNLEWKEKFLREDNIISEVVRVEGISLRKILDHYFPASAIDLLCVDAEGSDLDVLHSLSLETLEVGRYPKWVLLETEPPISNALGTESVKYVTSLGYIPYLVLPMSVLLQYNCEG
jgi:FkbM family methyltransferase